MTVAINTSPLSGQDGDKVTARLLKSRLDQEVVGNVSIRVVDTERPEMWEVQGRGELQLAILVEMMRREGFELTVGKPQVVTRTVDGKLLEPMERVAIDAPEDFLGVISQLLALRKGRMEHMVNHGTGWIRMEYLVPARGLIGFRTEFMTETRGTGQLHHVFEGYEPWHGELRTRPSGSLVADRRGETTQFALLNLQERGSMFVGPGEEVYEGMIVGENARAEDMDVNPTKEKHLTNMRKANAEELVRLIPKTQLSLEQALEFLREDECVEVTPRSVRLRKVLLAERPSEGRAAGSAEARLIADPAPFRVGSGARGERAMRSGPGEWETHTRHPSRRGGTRPGMPDAPGPLEPTAGAPVSSKHMSARSDETAPARASTRVGADPLPLLRRRDRDRSRRHAARRFPPVRAHRSCATRSRARALRGRRRYIPR